MGTGAGEKGWWLAEHLTIKMAKAMESGEASTREQAINIAHGAWRQELGKGMKVGEEEDTPTPAPTPTTTGKGRGHLKGDLVGEDGVSRLFTEPTTMEMVFDCRAALWAFGNTLTKTNATNMLKPSGAPLAAHFWLALRTLIKVRTTRISLFISELTNYVSALQRRRGRRSRGRAQVPGGRNEDHDGGRPGVDSALEFAAHHARNDASVPRTLRRGRSEAFRRHV